MLGVLLPLEGGWASGKTIAGAVPLAIERINDDDTLLPGHTLDYTVRNSGCSAGDALQGLGQLAEFAIDAVIGPGCSTGCEPTGYLTAGLNLAQVSYGCSSPSLSDQGKYPTFVRVVSSLGNQGEVVVALMGKLGWKTCAMLHSTDSLYLLASTAWNKELGRAGVSVDPLQSIDPGAEGEKRIHSLLLTIVKSRVRVVFVLAYKPETVMVVLEAQSQNMFSPGWAWIGTATTPNSETTADDPAKRGRIEQGLHGWLYIKAAQPSQAALSDFYDSVKEYGEREPFGLSISAVDSFAVPLYDSIYLFAHAATRVLETGGKVSDGLAMVEAFKNVSFEGMAQRSATLSHHFS